MKSAIHLYLALKLQKFFVKVLVVFWYMCMVNLFLCGFLSVDVCLNS